MSVLCLYMTITFHLDLMNNINKIFDTYVRNPYISISQILKIVFFDKFKITKLNNTDIKRKFVNNPITK